MTMSVRLAPRVGYDAATFIASGETIFKTVAVVGRDYVFMSGVRARRGNDTQRGNEYSYPKTGDFHS
jgi:hypothetical protein